MLLLGMVWRYLPMYGKSVIWTTDGVAQYYPALQFLNDWLRGIIYNPSHGVPLWSWHIGLGADIVTSLSFYVVGDPFALISLAFPMRYLEWAFPVMLMVRALAAVITSSLYFRRIGAKPLPAAAGAIIFVFAMYLYFAGLHHPMFLNGLVFLPLLLIGVENALDRRRGWTLTAFVFLAAAGNFYFFYMLTLITVIYAVARYLQTAPKTERWRGMSWQGLRLAGYYVAGVALAAPILLPTILAILKTARGKQDYDITLFYPLWKLRTILPALGASTFGEPSLWLGYAYLGLVLVFAAFVSRKSHSALKFMVVVFAFFVSLPVFGSIFNGLTFPSSRFAFAWGIFIAALAALLLSEDRPFTPKELFAMCGGFVAYVGLVSIASESLSATVLAPMVFGALTIAVFAIEALNSGAGKWGQTLQPGWLPVRWRAPLTRWTVLALLVGNVLVNSMFILDIRYSGIMRTFVDAGQVRGLYRNGQSKLIKSLPQTGPYRIDNTHTNKQGGSDAYYNAALMNRYMGTSYYYSIMDGHLTDYQREIDNSTGWSSFSFDGFDDRVMPTTLAGARYYITNDVDTAFVPYGFKLWKRRGENLAFRNTNSLPLGFVYTEVINRSGYDPMSPVDKPGAMLQGAVVDDGALEDLPRIRPTSDAIELIYTVESTAGATFDRQSKVLVRTQPDSRIDFAVEKVPDAEVYVELRGVEDVVQSPSEQPGPEMSEEPSRMDKLDIRNQERAFRQPLAIGTKFSTERGSKTDNLWTKQADYYFNDSQLVNLGYYPDGTSRVTIERSLMGTMTLDSLKVWALPMAEYPKRVAKLRANAMTDIKLGTNRVNGTVDSDKNGLLFLSIPYSTGWTAMVDGKHVKTIRVNTAYMGVPVPAGKHAVALAYVTPGLVPGILAAAGAILSFVAVRVFRRYARATIAREQ